MEGIKPFSPVIWDGELPSINPATNKTPSPFSFTQTLNTAIESLDKQQLGTEQEIARAVVGRSPDLHQTLATLQTTDLNFQFALQVRNKIIGAYEEIMRMQV